MILGQGYPTMEAPAIGRVAALDAGLPVTAGGYQLDARCGSGLQAVINAALEVQTGVTEVVIAGGVESMSNAPFYTEQGRRGLSGRPASARRALAWPHDRRRAGLPDARRHGRHGRDPAAEYGITREEQDEFALRSHGSRSPRRRAGASTTSWFRWAT